MEFSHYSVMKGECIDALAIKEDGIYVDCTCGGGGHSLEIVKKLKSGRLVCIDQDDAALAAVKQRLAGYEDRYVAVKSNFSNVSEVLKSLEIAGIDGALIDLGVSSYQLDTAERGFSYMKDAPLDMRMDQNQEFSAYQLVNEYSEQELKRVLYDWGEEKFAPQIARAIVKKRGEAPIKTTVELSDLIKSVMPAKVKLVGHHPAKKSFQAIRIEVNKELDIIEPTLRALVYALNPGGRLAVITFHSLEDRITKQTFASLAKGCTCPPSFPICVCGNKPQIKLLEKGRAPGEQELEENPRSRSARLRTAEKL
ncbi:MAG: 16S rRNA (cytosine(1402)-N(4))-methyltransferase RsmH [Clostridia bacterium]|nr:16S rRNA (cytosine(1402)-N(4))-methyltransferase RsmH [Clostridia bacterium]